MAAISKEGVDSIGTALKELELTGYLTRNRLRDERGRITDTEYVVYEFPQTKPDTGLPDTALPYTDSPYTENPYMVNPDMEKPDMANPDTDLPYTENPAQLNTYRNSRVTNESNNKAINNKGVSTQIQTPCVPAVRAASGESQQLSLTDADSSLPAPANPKPQQAERLSVKTADGAVNTANHAMTLVDENAEQKFEQFWQLYPRKASKKAARKAWRETSPDEVLFLRIMDALKAANRYLMTHNYFWAVRTN